MSFDFELVGGDLVINPDGTVKTATDTPKLRQDVLKIILTPLGSNKFHPWYGCSVVSAIVGKQLPDNLMTNEVRTTIAQSLDRLKKLQRSQSTTQKVSLAELINTVGTIRVNRNLADLRQLNVVVTVLTKRLTKVEEIFTIIS